MPRIQDDDWEPPPPERPPAPTPLPPPPDDSRRSSRGKHVKHDPATSFLAGRTLFGRRWAHVAVLAVAVTGLAILAGLAGFLLFLRSGGDGSPSAEDTVLELFTAAKRGDCETVADLVTDSFWSVEVSSRDGAVAACQGNVESQAPGWVDDYTVNNMVLRSQDEETATVAVGLGPNPGSQAPPGWIVSLVKGDDGRWRVDHADFADVSDLEDLAEGDEPGSAEAPSGPGPAGRATPPPAGAGAELDQLAVDCYRGDMAACDDLFDATYDEDHPVGSAHRPHTEYGANCGGRLTGEVTEYCEDLIPNASG